MSRIDVRAPETHDAEPASLDPSGPGRHARAVSGPMAERTERALVRGLAAVRVAQFVSFGPAALTAKSNAYEWGDLALWLYAEIGRAHV